MAGNPFRSRSANQVGASSIPSTQSGPSIPSVQSGPFIPSAQSGRDGAAELIVDTTPVKPKKVVKRVRIQSPVVSPYEPQDDPFDARLNVPDHPIPAKSPPPPTTHDGPEDIAMAMRKSFIDSLAKGASNLNQEATQSDTLQTKPGSLPRAPSNPFARTLATMEPSHTSPSPPTSQSTSIATIHQTSQPGQAPAKSPMNVNSFTRMLMTGAPSPLDSPTSARFESPRFSSESSRSDDGAGTDIDDQSSLMRHSSPRPTKPPPPPASHRGKPLSKKVPQTVSFDDFEADLASSTSRTLPDKSSDSHTSRPLAPLRSPSDLNKPLPAAPIVTRSDTESNSAKPIITEAPQSDVPTDAPLQPSKVRPSPPTSRRTSMRPGNIANRTRSNSSLSLAPITDELDDSSQTTDTVSLANKPPPPPPSRKHGQQQVGTDSLHSFPSELVSQASTNTLKAPPPPPSRRGGAPGFSRTPSAQSTASMGSRPSPSPGQSHGPAPPPPPPRRGEHRLSFDGGRSGLGPRRLSNGSPRSSIELRRASVGASSKARAPSISSLQHVPESEAGSEQEAEGTTTSKQPDILADLSAFQAEIDALRAQIGK